MTAMSAVKLTFGKINLKDAGGTLGCFRILPPFQRAPAAQVGVRIGKPSSQPASLFPAAGGGFTTSNNSMEEGSVLMLTGSRTRNRMRYADGVIFLRLRASAAYISIKSLLPTGRDSVLGDRIVAFSGCADIIGLDELANLGIEVPRHVVQNNMDPNEIETLFEIEVIRAATVPAPSLVRVATSKGVELKAMAAEPTRRLRLRR